MTRPDRFEQHNRAQIGYFEHAGREAMRPVSSPYVQRQVDELVRVAGLRPGQRVLEVGCGMGRYTFPLADRGLRVEGIDLSRSLLDLLASFDDGRRDVRLHCIDVLEASRSLEGYFDAAVGFFTLHHLHDLALSFEAMAAVVKPGGRVVFLEPNPLNVLYYVQLLVAPGMTWEGDKGILNMRSKTVFRAMNTAGLTRPSLERFGFFPPFVVNRRWGSTLERTLESVPLWRSFLPFQLFSCTRPNA